MATFKNQGYYTITAATGIDLTSATNPRIYYKKPSGERGYWPATISGQSLTYTLTNDDFDVVGIWYFQAYVEIGGLKAYGSIFNEKVTLPL